MSTTDEQQLKAQPSSSEQDCAQQSDGQSSHEQQELDPELPLSATEQSVWQQQRAIQQAADVVSSQYLASHSDAFVYNKRSAPSTKSPLAGDVLLSTVKQVNDAYRNQVMKHIADDWLAQTLMKVNSTELNLAFNIGLSSIHHPHGSGRDIVKQAVGDTIADWGMGHVFKMTGHAQPISWIWFGLDMADKTLYRQPLIDDMHATADYIRQGVIDPKSSQFTPAGFVQQQASLAMATQVNEGATMLEGLHHLLRYPGYVGQKIVAGVDGFIQDIPLNEPRQGGHGHLPFWHNHPSPGDAAELIWYAEVP
jgi:hypothetical protein